VSIGAGVLPGAMDGHLHWFQALPPNTFHSIAFMLAADAAGRNLPLRVAARWLASTQPPTVRSVFVCWLESSTPEAGSNEIDAMECSYGATGRTRSLGGGGSCMALFSPAFFLLRPGRKRDIALCLLVQHIRQHVLHGRPAIPCAVTFNNVSKGVVVGARKR
jgi:hypothetical protein